MLTPCGHLLADLSSAEIGKLIFGVLVFGFWIVNAIASAAKKANQQQEAKLRAARRGSPPSLPVTVRPSPLAGILAPPPASKRKFTPKPGQIPAPPRVAAPLAPAPAPVVEAPLTPAPAARPAPPTPAHAVRVFLQPRSLRTQYILTEILRPPLALRESEK